MPGRVESLHAPAHPPLIDSLDAQCLLVELVQSEIAPPDLWKHDRSGALSAAYADGQRSFTWSALDVAAMARTWRRSGAAAPPEPIEPFRHAHERLAELAIEAGLGAADALLHDLARGEVRAAWQGARTVVAVEVEAGNASRRATRGARSVGGGCRAGGLRWRRG